MAADAGPAFTLEYMLEPEDLTDLYMTDDKVRARRSRMATMLGLCTAGAVIVLGVRGVWSLGTLAGHLFSGATGLLAYLAIHAGIYWWRAEPSRQGHSDWKRVPEIRGRHRDDIGPGGITGIWPDGRQGFVPWSDIATVQETSRQFVLRADNGEFRVGLPKRGLHDPASLPALGAYVREAVGMHPPTSSTTGIRTQP